MFARLLTLFLLTPVVELILLIRLGDVIGFWPTVGIILVTGFTGTYLARREGLSAWRRLQERLKVGGLPGKELIDGVIILIAGALLITPGVLTDVVGFLGLLPFTRARIRRYALARLTRAMEKGAFRVHVGGFPPSTPPPPPADGWMGQGSDIPSHRRNPGDGPAGGV